VQSFPSIQDGKGDLVNLSAILFLREAFFNSALKIKSPQARSTFAQICFTPTRAVKGLVFASRIQGDDSKDLWSQYSPNPGARQFGSSPKYVGIDISFYAVDVPRLG
jgi:hypothetical protein